MLTKNQKRTYLYPPGAGLTISMPVSETESGESSKGSGKFRLAGPPIRQLQLDLAAARSQFSRYPMVPAISFVSLRPREDPFLEPVCVPRTGRPVHQVIGRHDQFEIEPGTCPMPRNTLVQTESVELSLINSHLSACHAQAGSRHACCKLARPSRQEPCCWRQSLDNYKDPPER